MNVRLDNTNGAWFVGRQGDVHGDISVFSTTYGVCAVVVVNK